MRVPRSIPLRYLKINEYRVVQELSDTDFSEVVGLGELLELFRSVIAQNTVNISIKSKNKRIKPYITQSIIEMIHYKNKLYKVSRRFPESQLLEIVYKQCRNKLCNTIQSAKRMYFSDRIQNNLGNPRRIWKTFNEVIYNKASKATEVKIPVEIAINGGTSRDTQIIVNELNKAFVNLEILQTRHNVENENLGLDKLFKLNKFNFTPIAEFEMRSMIKKIKNGSPGYDSISKKIIQGVADYISGPLTVITNRLFSVSKFPNQLKIAKVTPIHKGGDINDPNNYRCISVLPILSKPLEYIMHQQISDYLQLTKTINKNQFGFVQHSNTTSACVSVVNSIQSSLDRKQITAALFLDLSRAFDSLNKECLLRKLYNIGFDLSAVNMINSYLSERVQFVEVKNVVSMQLNLISGVPQGSILGPVLFNIYINDIFDLKLNGKLFMYADDGIIVYSCEKFEELKTRMENDLLSLNEYFENSHLKLNLKKTNYMIFRGIPNLTNPFALSINSQVIQRVKEAKYLGLHLNEKLSWDTHINHIKNKLSPFLSIFYRLRSLVPTNLIKDIYFAHVHSHLLYLNPIWSCAPKNKIKELAVMQNKVVKIMYNLRRRTPTELLYDEKIISLSMIIQLEGVLLIKKLLLNTLKADVTLVQVSSTHGHETRGSRCTLQLHSISTNIYGRNAVLYRGISLYNALPDDIKTLHTVKAFRSKLREYLLALN